MCAYMLLWQLARQYLGARASLLCQGLGTSCASAIQASTEVPYLVVCVLYCDIDIGPNRSKQADSHVNICDLSIIMLEFLQPQLIQCHCGIGGDVNGILGVWCKHGPHCVQHDLSLGFVRMAARLGIAFGMECKGCAHSLTGSLSICLVGKAIAVLNFVSYLMCLSSPGSL